MVAAHMRGESLVHDRRGRPPRHARRVHCGMPAGGVVGAGDPFELRLLAYLAACVEAEATEGLAVARDSRERVLITAGEAVVLGGPVALPTDRDTARWAARRLAAGASETVIGGWPVVTGRRPSGEGGRRRDEACLAPLLYCQVRVAPDNGPGGRDRSTERFVVEPANQGLEVNPEALRLLGVPRNERERAAALADDLAPSLSLAERAHRLIEALREAGFLPGDVDLDPTRLAPLGEGAVVHNAALCLVTAGDRTGFTRALLRDLRELMDRVRRRPDELHHGPLGILLGRQAPPGPPPAEPLPVVVPTNAEQELAAVAAMRTPFAVVTGPPGTGKTQVLVNVAAAAVVAGETVLLASKNNHAIDVVHERLRALPGAAPVRTGNATHQREAAAAIAATIETSRPGRGQGAGRRAAEAAWERARRAAQPAYGQLAEIDRRQAERDAAARALDEHLARMAPALAAAAKEAPGPDADYLVASHQRAGRLLDELDRVADRWWRRRRRRRLAEEADEQVRTTISLAGPAAHDALVEVLLREGPRAALAAVADLLGARALRERVQAAERALALLPDREAALRDIDASLAGREEVGRELLAAAWSARLGGDPVARAAAGAYAQQLGSAPARTVRQRMPEALGAFPVWAVTSLSAGNNFPLVPGLFDLVVIDEASQSDLASAIPLLYRAKRALIVGDPHQLAHITTLTDARDGALAKDHHLSGDEHAAFSFKATSLFAAAERAQRRPPLLLRQHFRSHPDVIGFANQVVYGGQLVIRTPSERCGDGRALVWRHVEGPWERPANRSVRKPAEAEAVVEELGRLWAELAPLGRSIGVVSPFRAQVDLLRDLAAEQLAHLVGAVTIDTAHGFQGDERDVMIFSVAVAADLPDFTLRFAGDRHLVNVAVTRARMRLVVVGDHRACLAQPTLLGALARYAADLGAVAT